MYPEWWPKLREEKHSLMPALTIFRKKQKILIKKKTKTNRKLNGATNWHNDR